MPTYDASDLSSDKWAWVQTNGASGFRVMAHPSDDMTWSTAGSQGAVSWIHVDDDGFCTSTQILVGKKYWVVFYRNPSLPDGDLRGDMGSISWAASIDELLAHALDGWFVAEAIEMTPGTLLWVNYCVSDLINELLTGFQIAKAEHAPLCRHNGSYNHTGTSLLYVLDHPSKYPQNCPFFCSPAHGYEPTPLRDTRTSQTAVLWLA